jgi:hypothetical protein
MTRLHKFASIGVAALALAIISGVAARKYVREAKTLAERRDGSDRTAESLIMLHYSPTVDLARKIKDFEIAGSWSVQDVSTCIYMPTEKPCKKQVRLSLTARDLTTHQPVLSFTPVWTVSENFPPGGSPGEQPENDDAKKLFARIGKFDKEDPFASVREFANRWLSGIPMSNLIYSRDRSLTGNLLFDLLDSRPVRIFFVGPLFKRDPSCADCYSVLYAIYVEGHEYDAIFHVDLETEYIAPVSEDAKSGKFINIREPDWKDEMAARKIVFDSYYPNFPLPQGQDMDNVKFVKSPSCKSCFYVLDEIAQPVRVNSYRRWNCIWEVNIATGIAQPFNRDALVAFRPAGTQNPYETEYGNALEMK